MAPSLTAAALSSPFLIVLVLALPIATRSGGFNQLSCDIFVYGATPSGIAAAISASRTGARHVILAEPSKWIGGMMAGGLGCTDKVGNSSFGGIAREFIARTQVSYGGAARPALPHCTSHGSFEPHVATSVFVAMLREANVTVVTDRELIQVKKLSSNNLKQVSLRSGSSNTTESITANVFIDATYEGDLMAHAGVSFTVGREGSSMYGEPVAGRRPLVSGECYGFHADVSPFGPDGNALPMVWSGPIASQGGADSKLMAYNYRLCLTNSKNKTRRSEIIRPPSYNPDFWELLRRYMRIKPPAQLSTNVLKIYTIARVPANEGGGVKTDVNSAVYPISTNLVGGSWGYPNGNKSERAAIILAHKQYTKGLLWFLKSDASVPASVRAEMATWAWCADEFEDNDNFPTQLYIREARRMIGQTVLTWHDAINRTNWRGSESIGVADYAFDCHPVEILPSNQPTTPTNSHGGTPRAVVEGCLSGRDAPSGPFQIPFGAILPQTSEARNLLVPVALSASHVAFDKIRLELTWMVLGQSAGIAAAIAVSTQSDVGSISRSRLRSELLSAGQVLECHDLHDGT